MDVFIHTPAIVVYEWGATLGVGLGTVIVF